MGQTERAGQRRRPLPELPRGTWAEHARFPEQVLLLGSHENFRRISAYLVGESKKRADEGAGVDSSVDLLLYFRRWKNAMKNHERYEELKLYPYLEKHFEVTTAELCSQHETLGRADVRVVDAYEVGDASDVAGAFAEHDAALLPHLIQEEDLVIPCLLSLSKEEFRRTFGG